MSPAHRSPPPQRWASLLTTALDDTDTQGSDQTAERTAYGASSVDDLLARSAAAVERQLTAAQAMRARFASASARAAASLHAGVPVQAGPDAGTGVAPDREPVGGLDIRW